MVLVDEPVAGAGDQIVTRAERRVVLRVDVEGVPVRTSSDRLVARREIATNDWTCSDARWRAVRPAAQEVAARETTRDCRSRGATPAVCGSRLGQSGVSVAGREAPSTVNASGPRVQSARKPVVSACQASLAAVPARHERLTAVGPLRIHAIRRLAERPAVADGPCPIEVPPPTRTSAPCVSAAVLVTMLMTPLTAFAPHMAAPGPRITSMRSMSSSIRSSASQNTPEKIRL